MNNKKFPLHILQHAGSAFHTLNKGRSGTVSKSKSGNEYNQSHELSQSSYPPSFLSSASTYPGLYNPASAATALIDDVTVNQQPLEQENISEDNSGLTAIAPLGNLGPNIAVQGNQNNTQLNADAKQNIKEHQEDVEKQIENRKKNPPTINETASRAAPEPVPEGHLPALKSINEDLGIRNTADIDPKIVATNLTSTSISNKKRTQSKSSKQHSHKFQIVS